MGFAISVTEESWLGLRPDATGGDYISAAEQHREPWRERDITRGERKGGEDGRDAEKLGMFGPSMFGTDRHQCKLHVGLCFPSFTGSMPPKIRR